MMTVILLWGLILGPASSTPPPPSDGPGGLILSPHPWQPSAPPTYEPPPPMVPRPIPPKPTAPPAPTPQTPPTAWAQCDCLKWDYTADERLSHFELVIWGAEGMTEQGGVASVSALVREASCEKLHLFANGRYEAAVRAVSIGPEPIVTAPSNKVCVEVKDRHLYPCGSHATKGELCTDGE